MLGAGMIRGEELVFGEAINSAQFVNYYEAEAEVSQENSDDVVPAQQQYPQALR